MIISKRKKLLMLTTTLVLSASLLNGCTWVKKTSGAESVRVVPLDRVADCRSLGSVTVFTKDRVSVVNRNAEKVRRELETLAINDAAERGADTVVATTRVQDGQQTFDVYRCL